MSAGPEDIAAAVARLRAGGIVAFPTETVYGLGADALIPAAIARVFDLKGRPSNNPLIVHVSGEDMARRVAAAWPGDARTLARAFWPGPLTIVLPKAAGVPDIVTAGGPTVGIRCPDHHVTLALIEALGSPLVGPSANPSGGISPTMAEHVRASFSETDVLVLDGGPCRAGIESTVVSLTDATPRILRPGLIGVADLIRALGKAVESAAATPGNSAGPHTLASPGLLPVHYAPRTRARLIEASGVADLLENAKAPVVVITHRDQAIPRPHVAERLPPDALAYAAGLYAALRRADGHHASLIAIVRPPEGGPHGDVWSAVLDRLTRATGS